MTQITKILSLSKYDAVRHGLAIVLKGLFHLICLFIFLFIKLSSCRVAHLVVPPLHEII